MPGVGADLSGSADNGAAKDLYLQVKFALEPLHPDVQTPVDIKQIGLRLTPWRFCSLPPARFCLSNFRRKIYPKEESFCTAPLFSFWPFFSETDCVLFL
ncbi:MAG: hypothetical protein ACOYJY_04435 [Acutalibacteraceae bacterium]